MITRRKKIKYLFLGVFSFCLITLGAIGASSMIAYFHSGTTVETVHVGFSSIDNDLPDYLWTNNNDSIGNFYIKEEIAKRYVKAWKWINSCLESGDFRGVEDYLNGTHAQKMIESVKKLNGKIDRVFLKHELTLKHISADYSVAVLEDKNARFVEKRILENGSQIIQNSFLDIEVHMVQKDGYWKIFNWQINPSDTLSAERNLSLKWMQKMDKISEVRGINYYPQNYPWLDFWQNVDSSILNKDFQQIQELGFNTLRVFLPVEAFGRNEINTNVCAKLDTLLNIADTYGLKVIPTLFDFPIGFSYTNYPTYYRQLSYIVNRFKDNNTILSWNVKNEPDLDFKIHGKEQVIEWLHFVIDEIKGIDSIHPITIGWAFAENASLLIEKVDYVSVHHYEDLTTLKAVVNKFKKIDKPIVIEEFGASSASSIWNAYTLNSDNQHTKIEAVIQYLTEENIPWLIWTLYDFKEAPKEVFGLNPMLRNSQKGFGLINLNGELKPIGHFIKKNLINNKRT